MESYRKSAADSLRSLPKSERPEKLATLQLTEEYWKARAEKLKVATQTAEFSDDRTSLHLKTKNVYHGTDVGEVDEFKYADESTIGDNGVYFTVDPSLAMGYARLRGKERGSGNAFLYEAVLSDVNIMNWSEQKTVDLLKGEFRDYCVKAQEELGSTDFKDFAEKYGLHGETGKSTVEYALKTIIAACELDNELNGGNIKLIAAGVRGVFFEKFVKSKRCDGVITIEGGDDQEHTVKPGVSVVIYNRAKITSHRSIDITQTPSP
ncbi:hypothetical protein HY418_02825 [Candidatus Kaiserbacteria bacterium]|nr:hypothetical protein [Candidatus Kaiserbacteria bacterium]